MSDAILATIAAKQTGRVVKVALTRPQVFGVTTHRSATLQRVRLGAQLDGKLAAIVDDSLSGNRDGQNKFETAAVATRALYAGDNRLTRHRQLAERLNIDPIELRIRNEPTEDPERKVPFSSRSLVPCVRAGAERFGCAQRGGPAARTDGQWLMGMGVAAAIRSNSLRKSECRVRLDPMAF